MKEITKPKYNGVPRRPPSYVAPPATVDPNISSYELLAPGPWGRHSG